MTTPSHSRHAWPETLAELLAPGPEHTVGWAMLFGPQRERLGRLLAHSAQACDPTLTALEAAWLLEVQRLPHESERLLKRQPLEHAPLRAVLAASAAQMYDDAPAAAHWAALALAHFHDPLHPLHLWAQNTLGLARLECGAPSQALAPLQAALRGANRDGLHLLRLDALRVLARVHDELGDQPAAEAVLTQWSGTATDSQTTALPAMDSLRRLHAQRALRQVPLGAPPPTLPGGNGFAERLLAAQHHWVAGELALARRAVHVLRDELTQRYCPFKWQVELGALHVALHSGNPAAPCQPVLSRPPGQPDGLYSLRAEVLDAGHARLAGAPWPSERHLALAQRLQERQLQRQWACLLLVQADDVQALDAWWQHPARDPLDVLWLAPCLLGLWQQLVSAVAPRRDLAQQQALQSMWEHLTGPATTPLTPQPSLPPPADLTPREWEVLQLIAEQWSNAQIAGRLFVSEATVKTHINRLYNKLGIRDRAEAVLRARSLAPRG